MRERFRKFNLELHEQKTRLIEFGRFAERDRNARGKGKPEAFNFLGFTHICGKTKKNRRFIVLRKTQRKRQVNKLKALPEELRKRMHEAIPDVGKWLRSVLRGHYQYYGVPMNRPALRHFRDSVTRLWLRTLQRRSQKTTVHWERMERLVNKWLPTPQIYHPYPWNRLRI